MHSPLPRPAAIARAVRNGIRPRRGSGLPAIVGFVGCLGFAVDTHAATSTLASTRSDTMSSITPGSVENAFPVTLGSFSTTLVGSVGGRTHNIALACAALDGTVLLPGDVMSFNRVVGPRTSALGYVDAPVILREARQLQLGGGICQVASTVFTAGLVAGLAEVERHRHSTPINYIAPGEDATVSWGVKDLKLRNALDQPVRLRVEIVGSTLTARLEGQTPLEETYELVPEVHETADADAGAPGREIELFRVRRVNGEERGRELVHRDVFPIARARMPEAGR